MAQASISTGRRVAFGALLAAAALAGAPPAHRAMAQVQTPYDMINASAAASPITITRIRNNISALSGSGGNITALTGPDGVFLVDTGIAVSKEKITGALTELGGGRIRYAVNTHWHWDHADGNAWVRAAGGTVMAHPQTIEHLGRTIRVVEWGHTFTPVAKADRPSVAVPKERVVRLNGETIRIRSLDDGHTDGDLLVYFEKANVLALGDTFWNGMYPFIDYVAGGDIDRAIAQTNVSIKLANDDTRIVPGHGPVGTKADLTASRDMLVAVRNKVAALKAEGRSLEEVVAAKPSSDFDAKWGTSIIDPATFVTLVYRGV
jgi:glyoxylase-like metal-dependent hydrolase (beta-lactamase superfamily II)